MTEGSRSHRGGLWRDPRHSAAPSRPHRGTGPPRRSWGMALAPQLELSRGTKRHQLQRRKHENNCKYSEMGIQKNY